MSFGYHNADSVQNKFTFHACCSQIQTNLPFGGIKCHLDACSLGEEVHSSALFSTCPSGFAGMCGFWPSGCKVERRETFSSVPILWGKMNLYGMKWVSWLCSLISLFPSHCPPLPWREHPKTFLVACPGTPLSDASDGLGGLGITGGGGCASPSRCCKTLQVFVWLVMYLCCLLLPQSNIYFYFLPPQMEKTGLGKREL